MTRLEFQQTSEDRCNVIRNGKTVAVLVRKETQHIPQFLSNGNFLGIGERQQRWCIEQSEIVLCAMMNYATLNDAKNDLWYYYQLRSRKLVEYGKVYPNNDAITIAMNR